jgi:uncharacterized membrane protein
VKLRNLVSVVSAGILGCVSSFGFATPANADLNICSEAGSKAFVAISYKANGIIWSKGWLILEPGDCQIALSGNVRNMEIAITGQTFKGTIETGDVLRCTIWVQAQQTWTVKNADQAARCIGKERGMGGFNVFRTNNSRNYTYTVYD